MTDDSVRVGAVGVVLNLTTTSNITGYSGVTVSIKAPDGTITEYDATVTAPTPASGGMFSVRMGDIILTRGDYIAQPIVSFTDTSEIPTDPYRFNALDLYEV